MATDEERKINSKLKSLKKELNRNEELMRQAAISYEDLMAEKDALRTTIEDLRKTRKAVRDKRELDSVGG